LPSEIQVKYWFHQTLKANVAVVTGAVSGIIVLDVDPGRHGEAALAELVRQNGPLPRTVEAMTGDGGYHLYFAYPGGTVPTSLGLAGGLSCARMVAGDRPALGASVGAGLHLEAWSVAV